MKENNKKEKGVKLLPIVIVMLLVIIFTGASFAYFSARIKEKNKTETQLRTINLGSGLVYTGIEEINFENMIPGDIFEKTFTVENTTEMALRYNIYMEEITNEFGNDLVYTLTGDNGVVIEETKLPSTQNGKSYIKTGIDIAAQPTIHSYTLRIKYKYRTEDQSANMNKRFMAHVMIDSEESVMPTAIALGREVQIGTESFYVIGNDGTNVKLLSKYGLDISENVQSSTDADEVIFDENTNVYSNNQVVKPLVDGYAERINDDYGKTATGSLVTLQDLYALGCTNETDQYGDYVSCNASQYKSIFSGVFWTQTPSGENEVYAVDAVDGENVTVPTYEINQQVRAIFVKVVLTLPISELD